MSPNPTHQMLSPDANIPRYRYFFNGQEADNEVYGNGAVLGYEFRQYDARIGRWWNIDPMADKYPGVSPYAFTANRVVDGIELEGLEYLDAKVSRLQFMHDEIHNHIFFLKTKSASKSLSHSWPTPSNPWRR